MMMKLASLATLVASASAFAPTQQQSTRPSSSALAASDSPFASEIGAQMPLGYFDPLGVMEGADQAKFDMWRGIELKHGRVAMLAVTGYLTTAAGIRFPGAEDIPGGFQAFGTLASSADGKNVILQMMFFFILAEIWNHDKTGKAEFEGDFRNGIHDFGWDKQSAEWKQRKRAVELNQGRAAQMGILGLMTHDAMGNVNDILPPI